MFGRKEKAERYRALLENYKKLLKDLPVVQEELKSIMPLDTCDRFRKDIIEIGVMNNDQKYFGECIKYAESKYRKLRIPVVGQIENFMFGDCFLKTLENMSEHYLDKLSIAKEYTEERKKQPPLPLFDGK